MITHVKAGILYVSDQDEALDFYVGKLGFRKEVDAEMWPGARWVEVRPPGAQTSIVLASAAASGKAPVRAHS